MQKFKSALIRLSGNVWHTGLIVPLKVALDFLKLNDKRTICLLNKQEIIHVALMPKGNNTWFININKETQKLLKAKEGDLIEVEMETDSSKYGMPISEEFEELLKQDEVGRKIFESLTMGKQRTLIHQINTVKSSDGKIKKALTILDYLISVNGQLDFKELNLAFKNSRF